MSRGAAVDFSSVGRALGDVADVIAKRQDDLRAQDRVNKLITIGTAYNDEERVFKEAELQRTGTDTYDSQARGVEFRKSAVAKYTDSITDPKLKTDIERHIANSSAALLDTFSRHTSAQRAEVTKTTTTNLLGSLAKDAYAGKDLAATTSTFTAAIQAQLATGAIGAEAAVESVTAAESALAEAHLDGLISRSPLEAIDAIKSGRYSDLLPQEKIEDYDKKAKALDKAIQDDNKRQEKEAEQKAKEAKKEQQNAIGNEFVAKNVAGKLTETDILKSNLDPTGENSKQYWLKQLETRGKNLGKEVEVDKVLDGQIVVDMYSLGETRNGKKITMESVKAKIVTAINEKKMEGTRGRTLLDDLESKAPQNDLAKIRQKEALSLLERMGKYSAPDKDEDVEVQIEHAVNQARLVEEFHAWAKENPTGDPIEYVEKKVKPVQQQSTWTQFWNNRAKAKEAAAQAGRDAIISDKLREQGVNPTPEAIQRYKQRFGDK